MFFAGVLLAVISLHLVYLVDIEGAQGNGEDEAQPAVMEEVVACHAGYQAEEYDDDHVDFDFH